MALTLEDVQHVARLARLRLTDPEAARVDLSRILDLMAQLETVDTRAVEPLAHPLSFMAGNAERVVSPLRADVAQVVTTQAASQANAPAIERDLYLVPRVVE